MKSNKKGLTLIELLVAMAISAIVIALLSKTFVSQLRDYSNEQHIVYAQQEGKVMMETMQNIIKMARYGCSQPTKIDPNGINGVKLSIIGTNKTPPQGSDNLTIVAAIKKVGTITKDSDNTKQIEVNIGDNKPNIVDTNLKKYIFLENNPNTDYNIIKNIKKNGSIFTLTLNAPVSAITGENVYLIKAYTFSVYDNCLQLNEHAGRGNEKLSDNIVENLQFQYGYLNGSSIKWSNSTAGIENKIKLIKIFLLIRTKEQDSSYTDTKTYNLAGYLYKPNNHYHHYLLTSTVYIRNN